MKAVRDLKQKSKFFSHLKISKDGQLIFQTDVSDYYWGVILIEDKDTNKRICGYKSGQFLSAQ